MEDTQVLTRNSGIIPGCPTYYTYNTWILEHTFLLNKLRACGYSRVQHKRREETGLYYTDLSTKSMTAKERITALLTLLLKERN